MSPLLRSGLAWSQEKICSTLPQRGPCGYAASPRRVFSAPALGTGYRALLLDRGHSSRQERLLLYIVPQKRRGEVQEGCLERKESNLQHSERRPVVTAQVVGTDGWGRAPAPPQSALAASAQAGPLMVEVSHTSKKTIVLVHG